MENKLIGLIMGAVVGIIIIGSLLVPVIDSTSETHKTFTNNGFYRMSEISADDEETVIEWSYQDPYVFTINGVDVTIPFGSTSGDIFPYTIFASDGWGLRFNSYNYGNSVDLNLYGSGENSTLIWYATVSGSDTATITFNGGTASFSKNGGAAVTQTYTTAFIPDENGAYTLKKGNESAYLNADSLIYSTGRTSANFGSVVAVNLNLTGNIEDGETVTVLAPTGYTVSDANIDYSAVDGYIDLYSFDKVTFDIVQTSDSKTAGAVYSQVIVPYQVTAEKAAHLDSADIAVLAAIPVLMIAALVIFGVRVMYARD